MHRRNLSEAIERYHLRYPLEIEAVQRFRKLLAEYPNCFERTCWAGHITGSAWLVDASGEQLLLTNHRKLKMWLQLGGHSDGDANTSNSNNASRKKNSINKCIHQVCESIFQLSSPGALGSQTSIHYLLPLVFLYLFLFS